MSREALDSLEDILENALAACEFARDLSREAFVADRKTLYAVMRALEIIGEAAKRIPDHIRSGIPTSTGAAWLACATSSSTNTTGSTPACLFISRPLSFRR